MTVLAIIGKILASLGGGGIVGLIGGYLKDRQALKKTALDNDHELALRAQDLAMRQADIAGQVVIEGRKADARETEAETRALEASYEAANRTRFSGLKLTGKTGRVMAAFLAFTEAARSWVRISITLAAAWFLYEINGFFFRVVLTPEMVAAQQSRMMDLAEIVFLTTLSLIGMAIGWWYGSRGGIARSQRPA